MGLLDSLSFKAQELVGTKKSKKIADTANKALTILSSPIQSISNFKKAQEETSKKSALRLVGEGVTNVLTVATPFTSVGKKAVVAGAKALVPKTAKQIAGAVVGVPVAVGALSSPKIRGAVGSLLSPSANLERGEKIADIVEGSEEGGDISKIIAAGGLLGVGGALGAAAGVGVSNLLDKEPQALPSVQDNVFASPVPVTAARDTVTTGAVKKTPTTRRRKAVKEKPINVSQRVNVVVSNKSSSVGIRKKYINESVYN